MDESVKPEKNFFCLGLDIWVAETVGFEPTDRLITDQTISSRSRYDLFDTSPYKPHTIISHYAAIARVSFAMMLGLRFNRLASDLTTDSARATQSKPCINTLGSRSDVWCCRPWRPGMSTCDPPA